MLGMWDVGDVGCWGCGMLGIWDVRDVGCSGCGMFGMWYVGCGMFAGMWDVDLQNVVFLYYLFPTSVFGSLLYICTSSQSFDIG